LLARGPATGLGRRGLGALFEASEIRVNGTRARKGTIVRAGDTITVSGWALPTPILPPPVPLTVVYEDANLIAIDKAPGVPALRGRTAEPSVAATLLRRFPEMVALDDARHAGLVHRLDTGTSGLLLAARHPDAFARLRDAFTHKTVQKDYLAVVVGRLAESRMVTLPLARHRRSRARMVVARGSARAWPARTEITALDSAGDLTVVRLRMRTGVTHQLRVHLAAIGHPIVGDTRYGAAKIDPDITAPTGCWHYLHARAIAFDDPDLPGGLTTSFPAHWQPLFAARKWSTTIGD
jgi:23S rRNA pseudouridine1911/1915/1917 synthase